MTLYSVLLERLWLLGGALIALQFVLIAIWSWRRTPRAGLAVRMGFVAAPLLLALSYFVQTPREKIESICGQLVDAIEREDVFAFERLLAPEFQLGKVHRSDIESYLERLFARVDVSHSILHAFEFDIRSDHATVEFLAKTDVVYDEWRQSWLPSKWRLTFRKHADGWTVTEIESIPVPPLHMRDLQEYVP